MEYDAVEHYPIHRLLLSGSFVAAYKGVGDESRLTYYASRFDPKPTMEWDYPNMPAAIRAMHEWAEEAIPCGP